ncbi:MAG: hypothetical protein ACOX6U_06090 [Oscillospiraceae bacterium]|jgi:hypothetical protein
MKQRLYAVYCGTRYEAVKISSQKYCLTAHGLCCPEGFLALNTRSHTYYKNVLRAELEALYLLETIAVYREHRLPVIDADDEWVLLATQDQAVSERFEMDLEDSLYFKNVPKTELTRIIEYRTFFA